jgi:teichuronic acid exporter
VSTLKDKAIKGVVWSAIERFGNQGIQFFIGLILARLLMPEDYGLIGMLLVFISIAQVFVEGGFSAALIRKSDATTKDYSTVFWFNLVASFIFYLVIFFCSPLIADFYKEPLLVPLAKVIGLNIIISAIGTIQKTILTKRLDFKSQAKINISSIVVSGLIGVIVAWQGYGVWSLVIQNLSRNVFMNAGFWIHSHWRPQPVFSKSSFKELFGFGSKLLASGIINAISENLYTIIIGKLYNAKSLGFYTRANQFQKLPVSSIYGAIGVVTYPVLAELKDDKVKLREAYRSMIRMVAFVLFPVMTILGAVAEPMIRILLTDKWLPSVPLLQILCIVGALYPLHAINLDILKVKGRSDLFLRLEVIKQVLNVGMILICYRWGVNGLVWGLVGLNVVCYYLNSFYSKAIIGYGIRDQAADLGFMGLLSGLMLLLLVFVLHMVHNEMLLLFLIPLLGIASYIFLAYVFRVVELYKIKHIFSGLLKKLRPSSL